MWPPIVRKCTFYCVDSANSTFHERVDGRCRKGSLLYTRETNSPLSFCPPPSELATGAGGHPPRWRCKKGEPFSHGGSKKEIAKTLKGEGERRGWLMHFSEATLLHHHRRRRRRRSCNKGSADPRRQQRLQTEQPKVRRKVVTFFVLNYCTRTQHSLLAKVQFFRQPPSPLGIETPPPYFGLSPKVYKLEIVLSVLFFSFATVALQEKHRLNRRKRGFS